MALTFDAVYYYTSRPDVLRAFLSSDMSVSGYEFALNHYNTFGWKEGFNPNQAFITDEYLADNPDVAAAGVNPFEHYNTYGQAEGRAPNSSFPALAEFDWEAYVNANTDLQAAGINTAAAAYDHYITYGWNESRPGAPDSAEFQLKTALANLQAAEQAVADFAEENGDVAGALTALETELANHIDTNGSDAQLEARIALANAGISDIQDEIAEVEGLADASEALTTAQEGYVAAAAAGMPAMIALQAEVASFAQINSLSYDPNEDDLFPDVSWGDLAGLEPGTVILAVGGRDILIVGENGQLGFADADGEFDPATLLGASQLLEDAQTAFDAAVAYAATREAFEEAIHNFILAANPDFVLDSFDGDLNDFYNEFTGELEIALFEAPAVGAETAVGLYEDLLDAQAILVQVQALVQERGDLRSEIGEAQALVDALEVLQENVASAVEAIEALGYAEPVFVEDAVNAQADQNDIFLFAGAKATDESIIGFEAGDLLFIGNGYTASTIPSDASLDGNADFGSLTGFDVFIKQVADDTVVYVELDTYDGHANGTWAGETITLVGVNADDVSFSNGYVSVNSSVA